MWESKEREKRDYIGLYELVADQLKKESETTDSTFRSSVFNTVLLPFTIFTRVIKVKTVMSDKTPFKTNAALITESLLSSMTP